MTRNFVKSGDFDSDSGTHVFPVPIDTDSGQTDPEMGLAPWDPNRVNSDPRVFVVDTWIVNFICYM